MKKIIKPVVFIGLHKTNWKSPLCFNYFHNKYQNTLSNICLNFNNSQQFTKPVVVQWFYETINIALLLQLVPSSGSEGQQELSLESPPRELSKPCKCTNLNVYASCAAAWFIHGCFTLMLLCSGVGLH